MAVDQKMAQSGNGEVKGEPGKEVPQFFSPCPKNDGISSH